MAWDAVHSFMVVLYIRLKQLVEYIINRKDAYVPRSKVLAILTEPHSLPSSTAFESDSLSNLYEACCISTHSAELVMDASLSRHPLFRGHLLIYRTICIGYSDLLHVGDASCAHRNHRILIIIYF